MPQNLFGGGDDNGAADRMMAQQAEDARQARAAEDARWQREQDRIVQEREAAKQEQLAQQTAAQEKLDAARREQANQQAAQAATGGATIDTGAVDKARTLAAVATSQNPTGASSGLPGFTDLTKKTGPKQSNSLVAQSGFNAVQTGGRRYT